jgi:hypothetical protein
MECMGPVYRMEKMRNVIKILVDKSEGRKSLRKLVSLKGGQY